jgi:hypothetical protein
VRFGGNIFAIIKRRRRIVSFCRARRKEEGEGFSAFVELKNKKSFQLL